MADREEYLVGKLIVTGGGSIGTLANVAGLTVKHKQMGNVIQSIFTLTNVEQSVVNGTEYQSTLLFTFPQTFIKVNGSVASLAQKTTSTLASSINASSTGAWSIGTAAASSTTLSSAMANFIASNAFTSSSTVNVAGDTVTDASRIAIIVDSNTSAKSSLYLNSAFATTGDVGGDGTQTFSGTFIVNWMDLGSM
jgi:hypothetical protein